MFDVERWGRPFEKFEIRIEAKDQKEAFQKLNTVMTDLHVGEAKLTNPDI
jgi:hypothetical protein